MNLYEIEKEIMNCIDEETGEILNEDALNNLQMEQDKKIENIALWIKNLKAEAEALKNEKMAFAERQRITENKAESLTKYLQGFLAGNKYKSDRVSISYRKSETLEIENNEGIPFDYISYEPKIDKAGLKKAIKEGLEIDGCKLVEKQNMQIK